MTEVSLKRKSLSVDVKLQIIRDLNASIGRGAKKKVAEKYGIKESTMYTILSQQEKLTSSFEKGEGTSRKRLKLSSYENLDAALLAWFTQQRSANIPISGPILIEKATQLAHLLNIENFKSSSGYLSNWKKRHGISFKAICGESKSADSEAASRLHSEILPTYLRQYESKNIYNADETALFFVLFLRAL